MSTGHSTYSASAFEAAMLCPGKVVLEAGLPNRSTVYSATGTVAHALLESRLSGKAEFPGLVEQDGFSVEVDEDMHRAVAVAEGNIREMIGTGMMLTEQSVNYSSYLGVPEDEAWGTADVLGIVGDELQVHDYKHGSGVEVDAEKNPQMMLYGLGALQAVNDLLGPFKTVRLVIHQPNVKHAPSEWTISVEDLEAWGRGAARSAVASRLNAAQFNDTVAPCTDLPQWQETFLHPGEKQCKFCRAKANCPALRAEVADTVFTRTPASVDEFDAAVSTLPTPLAATDWVAASLAKVDMIEDWCKAVRAEAERRLLAGEQVPGYKLVAGKAGARAWSNKVEAEAALKSFRLRVEDMYDLKLISPTSAEKLVKGEKLGPRQWAKLQPLITRAEGKPHVAPVSDPRPVLTLTPVAEDFTDVSVDLA